MRDGYTEVPAYTSLNRWIVAAPTAYEPLADGDPGADEVDE